MANKAGPKKAAYDKKYNAKPEQKKKRAQRNAAAAKKKCPKGEDVEHIKPLRKGGTNAKSNLKCVSKTKNRSWRKGKKGYD